MTENGTALVEPQRELTPLSLIKLALEQKVDPDQLGKLLDLQREWNADRAVEAFNGAMQRCQAEMPVVVRDAKNNHTNSRYARLEAVNNVAKPVYTKHGLSLSFGTEDTTIAEHIRIVADVRHAAGHCVRYKADIPMDGKGAKGGASAMNAPQATGSTYAYGQRYLMKLIFNLTIADEDNDAAGECLSEDQIAQINIALEPLCEKDATYFIRFLKWLNVESLAVLPAKDFLKATDELKRKTAALGAEARKAVVK